MNALYAISHTAPWILAQAARRHTMQEAQSQEYAVSRLVAFSDAVYGFAITLLITTLSFPDLSPSTSDGQIIRQLLAYLPRFFSYVLSFYIVAVYWVSHHRAFRYIVKFDNRMLWINLTLLLFIAFLPFPTFLLGTRGDSPVVTALYAVTLSVISFFSYILWWYSSYNHRLIPQQLDQKIVIYLSLRALIPLGVFVVSIGLSFVNPTLAHASWIAIFFVRAIFLKRYMREYDWV